ncbi:golgin-84 isoform X2 [Parasteatoda tepidariorum]|uniref:golgin-84 isoform X2 n=1 Tax=Parasteatoda tepidariorum TaxID=114398 RepID=UPI001C719E8D|nr:golgin subfamily A member 5 isoform X2 [Parasteatoda tepidariorum]
MSSQESHGVVLPSDDSYLGVFPELQNLDLVLLRCQYCDKCLMPNVLKDHTERCPSRKRLPEKTLSASVETDQLRSVKTPRYKCESPQIYPEQMHRFSSTPISSGNSLPNVNSSALSEVDTSSSNSSPVWESDKSNTYDSLSSSSSNSVNIVRLKHDKSKFIPKDTVIPVVPLMPSSSRSCETTQEPVISDEKPPSPAQQFLASLPNHKISNLQAMLPVTTSNNIVSTPCSTPETFKCRSFFETIEPSSSFVTTVKESSSEMGKTPKLIIRRVSHQNPNDVRRIALNKGIKENPNADNLRCFLLTKGQSRPQKIKPSKHQVKFSEANKEKEIPIDERDEYLRASEQQISILTGRIEVLNRQIEKLTGQVGPLRIENEEYRAEIRNLRSRVEELENSTTTLIEQRNLRVKNDKKIEELKQSWERERFHFTQRLEEMKTELSDYKNSSAVEKHKLTLMNIQFERKYTLQEALLDNLQKEKEILERHLPPSVHYRLATSELVDIQNRRSVIYACLNGAMDCHLNTPQTMAQPPRNSRQILDMTEYIPKDTSAVEMLQTSNGQLIKICNLTDNKIQYQGYSTEMTDVNEIINLKGDGNSSNEGAGVS